MEPRLNWPRAFRKVVIDDFIQTVNPPSMSTSEGELGGSRAARHGWRSKFTFFIAGWLAVLLGLNGVPAALGQAGSVDTSFVPGIGFPVNATFGAMVVQPDGRILVGGSFSGYGGTISSNLVRLNANGSLDSTFATGLGFYRPNDISIRGDVRGIALQPDGKCVVVGLFDWYDRIPVSGIVRLTPAGGLDNTFANGINRSVQTVTLLRSHGVIHDGFRLNDTFTVGLEPFITGIYPRLSNGDTNSAFDSSLKVVARSSIWGAPRITAMVEQPDGRILVTGYFTAIGGVARTHIARLHANGTLDSTFDVPISVSPVGGLATDGPLVHGMLLQPDGKIVIYGRFEQVGSVSVGNIARLNPDGTVDPTFNSGTGAAGFLLNGQIMCAVLQGDGKIVIGGTFQRYNGTLAHRLARIMPTGGLDTNFDIGRGPLRTEILDPDSSGVEYIERLALQPNGRIVVAGQFPRFSGVPSPGIVRLMGNGPVITNSSTLSVVLGVPFTYQITALNNPNSFAISGAPPGVTVNPTTGLISGTITSLSVAPVTLSASNINGVDSKLLSIIVQDLGAPQITQPPAHAAVLVGSAATFTVGATGQAPLAFQWLFNGADIPTATNSSLMLNNVQPSMGGTYSVRVSNTVASVVSPAGVLSVFGPLDAPTITEQPTGVTNFPGATIGFSVTATSAIPLNYQWRFNGTNLPGATNSTLSRPAVTLANAGTYGVTAFNALGSVTSSNAALFVRSAPVIVTPPAARVVSAVTPVQLNVVALGDAPLTYQWRRDGQAIAGATNANFSIGAAAPAHAGLYTVAVSNNLGFAVSPAARLTVLPQSVVVPWVAGGGGPGTDVGNAIAVDAAGNSVVVGYFTGTANFGTNTLTSAGMTDSFVVRYNASGQVMWARRAGGSGFDAAKGVAVDAGGNIYVTGAYEGIASFGTNVLTNSTPTSYSDIFLARYDAAGNSIWARSAGLDFVHDEGTAVAVDGTGNVLVAGRSALATFAGASVVNAGRIIVAKFSSTGAEVWAWKAGSHSGGQLDSATGVACDTVGNIFVTGTFLSSLATFGSSTFSNRGNADMFLVKLEPSGALQWARQAGGAGEDTVSGVALAADGSAYVAGATGGAASFSGTNVASLAGAFTDSFVAKYGGNGSLTWVRQFGGPGISAARGVAVDAAGVVHLTGYFSGAAVFGANSLNGITGSYDAFLARLDAAGTVVFAQQAGGEDLSGDFGLAVGVDGTGNSVVAGYFNGTSSAGGGTLASAGGEDVLLARFNQFVGDGVPALGFQRMSSQLRMRWPLAASSYILQSATNLFAPMWVDETNALSLSGAELEVDVPVGSSTRFYRLRKPE